MQRIQLETKIAAPPERCFLLSLNIDLEMESTDPIRDVAIAGITHGIIGRGETVTWRGRHFGLMLTHQSLISVYDCPHHFQDIMLRGMFKSYEHDHYFEATNDGNTIMRDVLHFTAPLGPLGWIAETLVLRSYFIYLLQQRNKAIRSIAEAPEATWQRYLPT